MTKKRPKQSVRLLFNLMCIFAVVYPAYSQQAGITLNSQGEPLSEVFRKIETQSGLYFFFTDNLVDTGRKVTLVASNEPVEKVLGKLLDSQYEWEITGNRIFIKGRVTRQGSVAQSVPMVIGRITGPGSEPLPGASVVIKGTTKGVSTDIEGRFELEVPLGSILRISYVGMISEEMAYTGQKEINVRLKEAPVEAERVVITGIYTRSMDSFTGSAETYTVEELKQMGSTNILQNLKTLDASFAMLEDNQFGSDPNRLPNMEIRGKSSLLGVRDELDADPNQPLFILDGFESSLSAINDLDINRVESITILKDAASTAIYGSKAANGVVVVETVKPKAGQLQVSYNGSVNISMPDLTSYNMMNAAEKLRFDYLSGRYSSESTTNDINLNEEYNRKLKAIESGVDTYWLAEPVRVGVNHKHSLYVNGGEGNFLFGLGGGYNGNSGTMKKSMREVVNGNIDLIYRISKFQFSNKFSMVRTDYTNPIVSFDVYAGANPFYKKTNDEGVVEKWLENNTYFRAANPLWNARLNSRDEGKNLEFSNYFVTEYTPSTAWKFRGRFGITYAKNDTETFYSPNDTRFEDVDALKKGTFNTTTQTINRYEGELTAIFAKVYGGHRINLVAGGNIYSSSSLTQGYGVEGFPEGDFTYPSFSNGYPEYGTPLYYETVSRSLNGYLNCGYSFNNKYLLDFNLRASGSSVFGTSRKYNTTWSVGLAWNLHNEKFISDNLSWIDMFKIRASVGNPGNQSFDSAQTLLTYAFQYGSMNYFGLGALLNQIGNPDLKWQTTLDKNIGVDLTFLGKRLGITADYYHKVTDPLLIRLNMPSSSGTSTYLSNAGEQTGKGFVLSASYHIIRNIEDRILWMVRGNLRTQKNKIDKIGNQLTAINHQGVGANTIRYYDGSDPDDIWVVLSAGIDPSNGKELFYDSYGNYTYDFSYDYEVKYGNKRPKIEGVVGTSFTWKGLSVNINFRYQMGAKVFNEALYRKVENVTNLNVNQDKRALYERWIKPGDMVRFKDIANAVSTPMSSRFVQKENVIALESVQVSYEFFDAWIRKAGLSSLRVHASMRDVFRSSSIRSERGISYPFARVMDIGLSLNF